MLPGSKPTVNVSGIHKHHHERLSILLESHQQLQKHLHVLLLQYQLHLHQQQQNQLLEDHALMVAGLMQMATANQSLSIWFQSQQAFSTLVIGC